jgi:hypothetical protein
MDQRLPEKLCPRPSGAPRAIVLGLGATGHGKSGDEKQFSAQGQIWTCHDSIDSQEPDLTLVIISN